MNVSAPLPPPVHAYYVAPHLGCGLHLLPIFMSHIFDQIFLHMHAGIASSEIGQVDLSPLVQILDYGFNLNKALETLRIL